MSLQLFKSRRLLTVAFGMLLGSVLAGPGSSAVQANGPCRTGHCYGQYDYMGGPPTCFGYYSTCWRPWPAECCPCPSFAEIIANPETIAPADPLPLPPIVEPMRAPVPEIELEPPQPEEQSSQQKTPATVASTSISKRRSAVKPVQYGRQIKR